jgi:hypothetical protein
MKAPLVKPVRCAIYTRVSTDHGLDQEFNSLDAQYDAASAYIKSQAHAGWTLNRSRYDDGGYSGGTNCCGTSENAVSNAVVGNPVTPARSPLEHVAFQGVEYAAAAVLDPRRLGNS